MKAARAGSRKASVQNAFIEGGVDAAITLGASLNLAPGTIRSWIGAWAKDKGEAVTLPKANSPKPIKRVNGRRVREIGFPCERRGTITAPGNDISTVRWDNGDVRNVSTQYLIALMPDDTDDEDAKSDWQRKEEREFLRRKELK